MEEFKTSKTEKRFPDNFKEIIVNRLREKDEIILAVKQGKIKELSESGRISGNWS